VIPWLALVLALAMGGGLLRLVRGPSAVDRMMAAQLLGTAGVALVLLLGEARPGDGNRTVGLALALLAAVGAITFARRYIPAQRGRAPHD